MKMSQQLQEAEPRKQQEAFSENIIMLLGSPMNHICIQINENTEYGLLTKFDINILQDRTEGKRAKILMYFNV